MVITFSVTVLVLSTTLDRNPDPFTQPNIPENKRYEDITDNEGNNDVTPGADGDSAVTLVTAVWSTAGADRECVIACEGSGAGTGAILAGGWRGAVARGLEGTDWTETGLGAGTLELSRRGLTLETPAGGLGWGGV